MITSVIWKTLKKGLLHKEKNDTRITWIGKIIRKTSIDLPQWICGTCDNAKKYSGDKKIEKGNRSNLIVEGENTVLVSCKLVLLAQ